MLRELSVSKDSIPINFLSLCSAILNWLTHLHICHLVGSYYHVISLCIILFIYWCQNSVRIFILLINYIMNVHIFCHYYEQLSNASVLLLIVSSLMLIIIAFIKLYTARRVFMETCFTTTIIFYIILNFYIFTYYILSYYHVDRYMAMDKLLLSISLWMISCWNVKANDPTAIRQKFDNRLTITAIVAIISQAIFLLRFIPFILEYNKNDIPLIILIILCVHIGSILIIFLSIDLSNELQLHLNQKTVSFGFSLILSIWVEYLLVIFYFAIYFVIYYTQQETASNVHVDDQTTSSWTSMWSVFSLQFPVDFGEYNFILLSIPGSVPWVMIMFANYRRDNIYHRMVFTEIFENYGHAMPAGSIKKISDILVRNGIGKTLIPLPINTDLIIDRLFAVVYLFGYGQHEEEDGGIQSED